MRASRIYHPLVLRSGLPFAAVLILCVSASQAANQNPVQQTRLADNPVLVDLLKAFEPIVAALSKGGSSFGPLFQSDVAKVDVDGNGVSRTELAQALAKPAQFDANEQQLLRVLLGHFDAVTNLSKDRDLAEPLISPGDGDALTKYLEGGTLKVGVSDEEVVPPPDVVLLALKPAIPYTESAAPAPAASSKSVLPLASASEAQGCAAKPPAGGCAQPAAACVDSQGDTNGFVPVAPGAAMPGGCAPTVNGGTPNSNTIAPNSNTTAPTNNQNGANNTSPANSNLAPIQAVPPPGNEGSPGGPTGAYNMFDHSKPSSLWFSGQANVIPQFNLPFHAAYSGPNSFKNHRGYACSTVTDFFAGTQILTPRLEALVDIERFDGAGLSHALGMGGLPDLDVVRSSSALSGKFYVGRLLLHGTLPLSKKMMDVDRSPFNFSKQLPERRLEFRGGLFSAADFLNYNTVGSDTHHQFLNWSVDNDGWYDYPADTRGYTTGIEAEYQSPHFAARFLEAALPSQPNGEQLSWNPQTHSETYELEFRHHSVLKKPGIIRLLAFENHASMGTYQNAINAYEQGATPVPQLTAVQKGGSVKFGFGLNVEQQITEGLMAFCRVGFNNGRTETWTYTEVDNTAVVGFALDGSYWHRRGDKFGLALVSNGISPVHARYLQLGGLGFDLGDGGLSYGRERIIEMYYNWHIWKGFYIAPDFQYVGNPGYNRVRGPVPIFGFRIHLDI